MRVLSSILLTMFLCVSCSKDEPCDIPLILPDVENESVYDSNIAAIEQYLTDNNLTAETTPSGLHYIIFEPGDDEKPDLCDDVQVAYTGFLLDGTVFDSSPQIEFPLTGLILGWREGIPLLGKGGRGVLLLPSYLGYGETGAGSLIPPNTVIGFDIELQDF